MDTLQADKQEILRYLGYKRKDTPDAEVLARIKTCEVALSGAVTPKSVQMVLPLAVLPSEEPDGAPVLCFGGIRVKSRTLSRHLAGCSSVMIFAATLGLGPDRLIQRAQVTSISDAAFYQAISAAMIEAYCNTIDDAFAAEAAARGQSTRTRFSPGYGDLPLDLQRDILRLLNAPKEIGLTLTDALLMMPSKSVTAIIGIKESQQDTDSADGQTAAAASPATGRNGHHCETCTMTDCPYRDVQ